MDIKKDQKSTVIVRKTLTGKEKSTSIALDPGIDTGVLLIHADIDPLDLVDPNKEVSIELWISDDGILFRHDAAATYRGGVFKNTDPPGFYVDAAEYKGKTLEVRISSPKGRARAGAVVEHKTDRIIKKMTEF